MTAPPPTPKLLDVAVVAIGRNEGQRLRRCLESVVDRVQDIIYVDSGSSDGSVQLAQAYGVSVVELDTAVAFTAARARNAGYGALHAVRDRIRYVQFVDGDCEVEERWLETARDFLERETGVGGVFGRRKERFPDTSVYNRLCDEEWAVPPGRVKACGGDVMFRASAFDEVNGYRASLIAGEEPEVCVRLRQRGWEIVSLAQPMTVHDAAMTRFSQWWRRSLRAGHAYAEGARLHGAPPERHWVRESRRAWLWGAAVPAAIIATTALVGPVGLSGFLVYPVEVARLYVRRRRISTIPFQSALFLTMAKFPEVCGQIKYCVNRVRGKSAELIEYK